MGERRGALWDGVVGQPAATAVLTAAVGRGEVPHALLLVGPPGVGQREAVRALAADLNCPRGAVACGGCSTCRRVGAGTHPAVLDFEPEGASHVVGAVREDWIPAATHTLVEGRVRVLRIAAADRMNEGAQNAFLKILEEPPPGVVWVLEAEDAGALLETVVSRCRRVDFSPWGAEALSAHAARLGIAEQGRAGLVRAAMGLPERLVELADPAVAAARRRHLGIVDRLAGEGPGAATAIAAELDAWAKSRRKAKKQHNDEELTRLEEAFAGEWPPGVRNRLAKRLERLEREERLRALRFALDDLASWLRDVLAVRAGGNPAAAVNADHAEELRRDADRVPSWAALEGLAAVADCAEALEGHGQPELQLERLLLRLGIALYDAGRSGAAPLPS